MFVFAAGGGQKVSMYLLPGVKRTQFVCIAQDNRTSFVFAARSEGGYFVFIAP